MTRVNMCQYQISADDNFSPFITEMDRNESILRKSMPQNTKGPKVKHSTKQTFSVANDTEPVLKQGCEQSFF